MKNKLNKKFAKKVVLFFQHFIGLTFIMKNFRIKHIEQKESKSIEKTKIHKKSVRQKLRHASVF